MTLETITRKLREKAACTIQAEKRYKRYIKRSHFVVAAGITSKGNLLICTVSKPAQKPKQLVAHAEGMIMLRYGKKIDTIYIAKFNRDMSSIAIQPCALCAAYAQKLGVKIKPLEVSMTQKKKKVLIICGGGVFGCIPAYLLGQLPQQYQDLNKVDLLSGCSIGGILAAAYASGNKFKEVSQKFVLLAQKCFTKRFAAKFNPLACPTYRLDCLKQAIGEVIPKYMELQYTRINYPNLDLIIPALNITQNKYKVYDNITCNDQNQKLIDIALQTAAAPSYFEGVQKGSVCMIDGGLIEVAPLLTATTALKSKRSIPFKDMDVLMIGVGTEIDREKLTLEKYNGLSILGLATDVIVPYVTEANQLATVFWGKNIGYNSFEYFNPCKIKGGLDDVSRIQESIKEAQKYKEQFLQVYTKWIQS